MPVCFNEKKKLIIVTKKKNNTIDKLLWFIGRFNDNRLAKSDKLLAIKARTRRPDEFTVCGARVLEKKNVKAMINDCGWKRNRYCVWKRNSRKSPICHDFGRPWENGWRWQFQNTIDITFNFWHIPSKIVEMIKMTKMRASIADYFLLS